MFFNASCMYLAAWRGECWARSNIWLKNTKWNKNKQKYKSHEKNYDLALTKVVMRRLHTAPINQVDFIFWWMWFNGSPTKVQHHFLTNVFCYLRTYITCIKIRNRPQLIAVCKRPLSSTEIIEWNKQCSLLILRRHLQVVRL